jgi:hypothetical protein
MFEIGNVIDAAPAALRSQAVSPGMDLAYRFPRTHLGDRQLHRHFSARSPDFS